MADISSLSPWAPLALNRSGILRLKFVDAGTILFLPSTGELIPKADLVFYEFLFSKELPCSVTFTRQTTETGAAFWRPNVSFSLPHTSNQVMQWVADNPHTEWLAITEDYNGTVRALGGTPGGLVLTFEATTGARPGDTNPMAFALTGEQIQPFIRLASYENAELFPPGEFDYSFDNFSFS